MTIIDHSPVLSAMASVPSLPSSFSIGPSYLSGTHNSTLNTVYSSQANATKSAASSSSLSLSEGVNVARVEGLRHAEVHLQARKYQTDDFSEKLLNCLRSLKVPSWATTKLSYHDVKITKVSGSLTNAVFFVASRGCSTLLLRIYGASSSSLISRPRELHILHVLSSRYHIGPRIYGTFQNGRVEEYFHSTTLTPSDIRDPNISCWIGARMAELHSVDIEAVEGPNWELGVDKNVRTWMNPAEQVVAFPTFNREARRQLDLARFKEEWKRYTSWLSKMDNPRTGSQRVFAHNDTQYGNLLKLQYLPKDCVDEHRQLIVVDFEYASPNPASFDIANHFHEWTANYHSDTPHVLNPDLYPTREERRNFYSAYLGHTGLAGEVPVLTDGEKESQLTNLDAQVRIWSPASHGMWAIWGLVQAREDIQNDVAQPEFDYVAYAMGRMVAFRKAIRELGV